MKQKHVLSSMYLLICTYYYLLTSYYLFTARFRWLHDGVFVDLDGSYSGTAGNKVLPWMDTMNPNKCVKDDRFSIGAVQGAVCDSTTKFSRFSFNG